MNPVTRSAYKLLHNGALALAEAERNGIRIDVGYCKQAIKDLEKQEHELEKKILSTKAGKYWKHTYGASLKLGSADQLREVLKDIYDITMTGSLDKMHLSKVNVPLVSDILMHRKLNKARSTYLEGILKSCINGYLHPDFNLHTAQTFRSSCSNPNFQNIPIRDPWVAELIRKAFIPRKGNRIVEKDYSGIEVRIAACYHQDPTMIEYLETGYDMHSAMASECYMIPKDKVPKLARYAAKNKFVFPAFYGSYYKQIAPDLWNAIDELKLEVDGVPLKKHLKEKLIVKSSVYDAFEEHIQAVENSFWNLRFPVYTQWKKDWWETYLKKGYFLTKTGFICRGKMKRNEAINYPVQGSAFHCLLWSFIEMTKALKKNKMKSVLIGQIHDSALGDVPEDEFEDYVALFREISTERIREAWDWIILPLDVEVEATDVDKSWFTKKGVGV